MTIAPVEFVRASNYNPEDKDSFNNVKRLSYISKDSGIIPDMGRMNIKGRSLFYGSVSNSFQSYSAVLSEVRAVEGNLYKILRCQVKNLDVTKSLKVTPIGVSDYYRRGIPDPFQLHDSFKEIYDHFCKNLHPQGQMAINLCDAFLTDVLKRQAPESDTDAKNRLYEVTSMIAEECLNAPGVDGIVFPSTQYDGFPNIVLTPEAIDQKVEFLEAAEIQVTKKYDYEIYHIDWLRLGNINGEEIVWLDKKNTHDLKPLDSVIIDAYDSSRGNILFLFVFTNGIDSASGSVAVKIVVAYTHQAATNPRSSGVAFSGLR